MGAVNLPDESFLPQIVGVFYATFDPVAGPTVLHQVPECLISSSTTDDGGGHRSPSGSRSRERERSSVRDRGREASRARQHARTTSPSPMRIRHPQPRGISSTASSITSPPALSKELNSPLSHSITINSTGQSYTTHSSPSNTQPPTHTPTPHPVTHPSTPHQSLGSLPSSHPSSHPSTSHTSSALASHPPSAHPSTPHPSSLQQLGRASTPAPRQQYLLDFGSMSEYVIPKKSLHGKLVSFRTPGAWDANGVGFDGGGDDSDDDDDKKYEYRVIGLPMVLEGEGGKYRRNQYMWNVCFVFRANASLAAFEPVVRKTARILRSAELDTGYLSSPQPEHTSLSAVLEQIFEDLNSYSETSIPLDGYNTLELKLFPFFPNPPECHDWDVPIPLVDLKSLRDPNWDMTASRVTDYVDGINHSARIAQLADADPALVRETLRHMLYYQVIMMIDIFQYSNLYAVTPAFPRLVADESVISECGMYITRPGFPVLDWPALATLYAKLTPGLTVHKWAEENDIGAKGIDPRRFVSFGIIKGFLVRVHRWPVMVDSVGPLLFGPDATASSIAPDPTRRRVGFQSSGPESRESRDFRNDSTITRALGIGGDSRGDSAVTLRSGGSGAASIGGVSPGSGHAGTPPRRLLTSRDAMGRSLTSVGDTHPSISSRRTNTLRSGGGLSGFATTNSGPGVSQISRQREGRLYELEEELLGYLNGHHHADEIQVRMGMSWAQLEKVLGLDDIRNGVGRKGVAVVVR